MLFERPRGTRTWRPAHLAKQSLVDRCRGRGTSADCSVNPERRCLDGVSMSLTGSKPPGMSAGPEHTDASWRGADGFFDRTAMSNIRTAAPHG